MNTFIILQSTDCVCLKKNSDVLEPINKYVKFGDIYEGHLCFKKNKYYIDLGYNFKLGCHIFIPITMKNNSYNVTKFTNQFTKLVKTKSK